MIVFYEVLVHDIGSKANHAQATQSRDVIPFCVQLTSYDRNYLRIQSYISYSQNTEYSDRNLVGGGIDVTWRSTILLNRHAVEEAVLEDKQAC